MERLLQQIKWAIFGTGAVAAKFAVALKALPTATLSAVFSRTEARAEAFARQFGVATTRSGYHIRKEDDVDIVYIATPPGEHLRHALAAISAGKAVLLEKPFAASLEDAQRIVAAARDARVFCMEGMWTRFLPALAAARGILARGEIGQVRALWGSFAIAQKVDPETSLFQPEAGGGALAHRGVYPISLALDLLGPARLAGAWARRGTAGVDEDVSATLVHQCGAASHIYAGLCSQADNGMVVLGDRGRLTLRGPIYRPLGVELTSIRARGRETAGQGLKARLKETAAAQGMRVALGGLLSHSRYRPAPYAGNGYGHEALAAMDAVREGLLEHPTMPLDDTLAVAGLMDQIRSSWSEG